MVEKESYRNHGLEKRGEKTRILSSSESTLHRSKSVEISKENSPHLTKVPSRTRSSLVLFSCLFLQLTTFGLHPAYGIIYVELIEEFQSSRAVAALVQSCYLGTSLAGGVLISRFITKFDVGICIMVASTVGFTSNVCASFAPNIATVIVLMGVVSGLCASVNTLSSYSLVSWFFVNNRKSTLSAMTVGSSVGQAIIPYITSAFIKEYYWNGCVILLSAMFVFNCLPCGLLVYMSRDYYRKPVVSTTKTPHSSLRNIVSDSAFMLYLFTTCLTLLFGPVETLFVADLAVMKGFGIDAGAVLLSLNGILGLVSKIWTTVMFKIYPKTRAVTHMSYSYIFWGISHIAVVMSPVYWVMVLSMILRGCFSGILFGCVPNLRLDLRGADLFHQTMAISSLVSGVSNVLGGTFGGYITDITGSYNLIFYIAAISCVVCSISMLIINTLLKRRRNTNGYETL